MDRDQQHHASVRNCAGIFRPHDESNGHSADFRAQGEIRLADIVATLRLHWRLCAVPAFLCMVLATAYVLFAPRAWRATQALIVRPEAAGVSDERVGKFSDLSEMKTLQETILELAKSQGVIEATLAQVGPSGGRRAPSNWPSPRDVEDFREQIDMRPPGGAEFGKTEVFYLSVLDSDRIWATRALGVLCNELQKKLQSLRDDRARSMIAELQRAVSIAESDLETYTSRLAEFEAEIGSDLVELRNMNGTVGGVGEVSQELQAIETERRANEASRRENARLLALLESAAKDPRQILATPSSLLRSQPAVDKLKSSLIDAQIRTANLLGGRSEKHPFVVAARRAEILVGEQLHSEIVVAIAGLNVELQLNADREAALSAKWHEARGRIRRLAESRAEYATLVAASENHTRLVEGARKNLADARARQAAAHSASVIGRIDGVEAGIRPVGPSRKTIIAAGGMGGLCIGLALVFLAGAPGQHPPAPFSYSSRTDAQSLRGAGVAKSDQNTPQQFGLFQGMTLEEAMRSVDRGLLRGNN